MSQTLRTLSCQSRLSSRFMFGKQKAEATDSLVVQYCSLAAYQ